MRVFLLLLMCAGGWIGLSQHRNITSAREELARERAARQHLLLQNDRQTPVFPSPEQAAAMRAERSELLRLRASLADLRARADGEEKVRAQIAKLRERTDSAKKSAKALEDTLQANLRDKAVQAALGRIAGLISTVQFENDGLLVRSFAELEQHILASPHRDRHHEWELVGKGVPPFGLTRDHFEFVPETEGRAQSILLREKTPRQMPSGDWARTYLHANFGMETKYSSNTDFTAWEQGRD